MLFLDAIGVPFYLLNGGAVLLILMGIAYVVGLTMLLFALFQRFSNKKKKEDKKL